MTTFESSLGFGHLLTFLPRYIRKTEPYQKQLCEMILPISIANDCRVDVIWRIAFHLAIETKLHKYIHAPGLLA
jgi:hypothetical protein